MDAVFRGSVGWRREHAERVVAGHHGGAGTGERGAGNLRWAAGRLERGPESVQKGGKINNINQSMSMSLLEQILTFVVWALVAAVFCHYRSLAIKQRQNHNSHGKRPNGGGPKGGPHGDVGWKVLGDDRAGLGD